MSEPEQNQPVTENDPAVETTRIREKFRLEVPPGIRARFGIQQGDVLDWTLTEDGGIKITPKRPSPLITDAIREKVAGVRAKIAREGETPSLGHYR